MEAIRAAHKKAVSEGTDVRAIVIINPGNPTGSSLSEDDVKAVIDFAAQERLVILADEVYQTNVFLGEFHSFKGVLRKMQKSDPEKYKYVELASLHSISKGMVGECGHRGGYFELCGFDPEVVEQIYKFVSISLCAPVVAQCLVEMMVNPPKEGEPSYDLYKQEYDGIFSGLHQRATALYEAFKQMEGVECQDPRVRPNLPLTGYGFLADISRAPCIYFPRSTCHQRPSKPPRRSLVPRTSSTRSGFWTLPGYASLPALGLVRRRVLCTSGPRSLHRALNGWGGSPSSTRSSWMSLDERRGVWACVVYIA